MLRFAHLPSFATWLLAHIDEYTTEMVRLFREADLSLLKNLHHLSTEEQFQFSKRLNVELLTNLSQNNAVGHIDAVTGRWLSGVFENVGRLDLSTRDITIINYVRSKAQKKFINQYTQDLEIIYGLHSEIDELSFAYNARSINDYIQVLKDRIAEETHFSQNIIEASPGIVFIYDLVQQKEVYINGRVEEVTGHTLKEVLPDSALFVKFTHPDDLPGVAAFLQNLQQDKEGKIYTVDYRFKIKSGAFHWMRCYAVVSKRMATEEPQQILAMGYDVSREKETALELEHSNEQLQEFAAIASHDLKEPLRKIGIFSNIIITSDWDNLSETTKTAIQKISDASIRMQKLIEGVLSYSAINAQIVKERTSLEQVLQEAISNLEYTIKETGASIDSDGLPVADVIPLQMQQLFQNLIVNSLKFSKKSVAPQITISHSMVDGSNIRLRNLKPAAQYLEITVADNGIGFSNDAAEKIFGMFQRLHNRSDFEGSGIGLAICKRIVENHGGIIEASSEKGMGSTFTVVLPVNAK